MKNLNVVSCSQDMKLNRSAPHFDCAVCGWYNFGTGVLLCLIYPFLP
jgi:hypothetical protein